MSIKVSGRNRFDRTHIINLAESISLYILSLNQSDEWNDRRMSGSLDSTLFPRKQWNGFYMAGLLTYSCCGRLPGIFFPVALSRLLATYLWNLQQRDCSGFTPDSLLIASLVWGGANQCGAKIESLFVFCKEVFFFFRIKTKEKGTLKELPPPNAEQTRRGDFAVWGRRCYWACMFFIERSSLNILL